MSKFWQGRASWKETVSSTVTGLSDGAARQELDEFDTCLSCSLALHPFQQLYIVEWVRVTCQMHAYTCRLRQNLAVPPDGRASPSHDTPAAPQDPAAKAQQYLRLPIDSAKKLRWYDRPDLNNLVQQNLREKNDILGVNAALRQVRHAREATVTLNIPFPSCTAYSHWAIHTLCMGARVHAKVPIVTQVAHACNTSNIIILQRSSAVALRQCPVQVLLSHGINEDDLEAELEEKLLEVDRMRNYDDGVNSVLVASAADEIASLRAQISSQADQIEQLNHRCDWLSTLLQNISLFTGHEQATKCDMLRPTMSSMTISIADLGQYSTG